MSLRYEYVPANAGVEYVHEILLDVEDPHDDQDVLVLWYDEAIVLPATPSEIAGLLDRIAAAVGLTHVRRSRSARKHHRRTGRYPLH